MPSRTTAATVLLLAACLGAAVSLQAARDAAYPRDEAARRAVMYVRSPAALGRIALSFDALLADVYWIRALQHYGGERRGRDTGQPKYELLYPLLDLTTSLDPYFTIAYRFGAIFLSERYPGGPGRPDQATLLLKKGIGAQPAKWQYYHDVAFVHYWHLQDMAGAAQWFRRAASQPGAPNWLEPVAATMLVHGGDRSSARIMFKELLKAEEDWLQRMALRSLRQLDALDQMDFLQGLVIRVPPPSGEPYSWRWLIRSRHLRGVPLDPSGAPFDLDPARGTVSLSRRSELFPLPARLNAP